MSPELGRTNPGLPLSPETALFYLQFILKRPDVVKKLNGHFEAVDIKVRVSDLVEFLSAPDYLKHLKEEFASPRKINLRTAFIHAVDKIEKEKELTLPAGEEKTLLMRTIKGLRESFEVKTKGSPVNNLVQNMPGCWQEQCVSNYAKGQGCETDDQTVIATCTRIFEPGQSSLGPRKQLDGVQGKSELAMSAHSVRRSSRASRWPRQ
jgi:hypothetical protein